jgi:CBS domain containing-hemolysin-like protein
MTAREIAERVGGTCAVDVPDAAAEGVYVGDLLSDVMGHAAEGCVLVTIQNHLNTLAVCTLVGCAVVVLCHNRPVPPDMAEAAAREGVAIVSTALLLLVTALLYFIVSGLVPGYIAAHAPERTLNTTSGLTRLVLLVLTPFTALIGLLSKLLVTPMGVKAEYNDEVVTEDEILAMVDIGEESGATESDEKQMIENIFEFNNMDAEDCMVHRKDIIAIDIEDTHEEILATIRESGLSRFPVYEDDIDNIVGIMYYKDFFAANSTDREHITELIKPVIFVAKTQKVNDLMKELQEKQMHLAIVTDEFGSTAGIITLEDILEEIVGDIWDEHDEIIEEFKKIEEKEYIVSGKANVEKVFSSLDIDEEPEAVTVNGWAMTILGRIPAENDVFEASGLAVKVLKMNGRRIENVHITDIRKTPEEIGEEEKHKKEEEKAKAQEAAEE